MDDHGHTRYILLANYNYFLVAAEPEPETDSHFALDDLELLVLLLGKWKKEQTH